MTQAERTDDMLGRYGEVCTKAQASKIMGCSYYKIRAMLEDGRLKTACAGSMVDVRSMAEYICAPSTIEEKARKERLRKKLNTTWVV